MHLFFSAKFENYILLRWNFHFHFHHQSIKNKIVAKLVFYFLFSIKGQQLKIKRQLLLYVPKICVCVCEQFFLSF